MAEAVNEACDRMVGNLLATCMDYLAESDQEAAHRVFAQALESLPLTWQLHAATKLSDLMMHWQMARESERGE